MLRAVVRFNETDLKEMRVNSIRRTIFASAEKRVASDPQETCYESDASVEQPDAIKRFLRNEIAVPSSTILNLWQFHPNASHDYNREEESIILKLKETTDKQTRRYFCSAAYAGNTR